MTFNIIALVCLSSIVVLSRSASLQSADDVDVTAFLRRFNYLPSKDASSLSEIVPSETDMNLAISNYQQFHGLEVTGLMDEVTYSMMQTPRCGVPDMESPNSQLSKRNKRFTLHGGRWNKNKLTYRVKGYSSVANKMSRGSIDSDIKKAFGFWSGVSKLRFTQVRGNADIEIKFGFIDGKLGVLGTTFYPNYGGDVTFEVVENWVNGPTKGMQFNFLEVATHEFGHAIGLGHSSATLSVMRPFYQKYDPYFRLKYDDAMGVYYKYTVGITGRHRL